MIIKKIILILFMGMVMVANSYATEPFPEAEYVSDSGRYKAVLRAGSRGMQYDQNLFTLLDKKENQEYSFSLEQLKLDSIPIMSTAGLLWYMNSIAVFDEEEKFFIIKLQEPQYLVVDLEKHIIVQDPSPEILENAKVFMARLALQWLDSGDPQERQTGAIVCKDLKISESIPKLKALLNDKEFYTTSVGSKDNKMFILFYVRKAAKEALLALGDPVGAIITELPERCLVEKDYRYVIDWENKKCQGIK